MPANALTIIHKYIRARLFELSLQLSRASAGDFERVASDAHALAELLRTHAEQEEARIVPALRDKDEGLADRMTNDHARLEVQFEAWMSKVAALGPQPGDISSDGLEALHLDLNRFIAGYLSHLDDEERLMAPLLAGALPPPRAIAENARARGPAEAARFLGQLWNFVTPEERAQVEA